MTFHPKLIDLTLREGEQSSLCDFSTQDKIHIAQLLSKLGVDIIEMTSPAVSPRSREDLEKVVALGLSSRIAAHVRCNLGDARAAIAAGVDAVHMFMASSKALRQHSHGMDVDEIVERAIEVAEMVRQEAPGVEIRFSCEDAFRTSAQDLLAIYRPLAQTGLFDRFGIADTVGTATPPKVRARVQEIKLALDCELGFHGHNDTGLAVANALAAVEGGATHIDTCVLGIGERNGITALEDLVACLYVDNPVAARSRFELSHLTELAGYLAQCMKVDIPFNHCIVGSSAFTHKAGVHTKAVLADPKAYEILDPADFGRERTVMMAHRLTGWNVMSERAQQLGLVLSKDLLQSAASKIKEMADRDSLSQQDVDHVLMTMVATA
ncbi:MAG TPA: hypothetical protein VNT30_25010 [Stellaceae bacterium]|nr:hypothetical protein [Stellaceae bacterium]